MAVIAPEDIKSYFRYAQNLDDDELEDFIAQEEYYVSLRLDVDPLPEDNLILFSIVRDLVIYRVVSTKLQRLTAEDYAVGENHRREAVRRLYEVEREGLTPTSNSIVVDAVYAPPGPEEFTAGDFWMKDA